MCFDIYLIIFKITILCVCVCEVTKILYNGFESLSSTRLQYQIVINMTSTNIMSSNPSLSRLLIQQIVTDKHGLSGDYILLNFL